MPLDVVRQLSIVIIIILCILNLQALAMLHYQTKEWRFLSLMLIPFSFCIIYLWIGVFSPSMELIRDVMRPAIIASAFIGVHVMFTYLAKLRRMGKRKEDKKI